MSKRICLLSLSLFLFCLTACDICTSSDYGDKKCADSVTLKKCTYVSSDYDWTYTDCSIGCPGTASCSETATSAQCNCTVSNNQICENPGRYRCKADGAIDKCVSLTSYSGSTWSFVKSCRNAFPSDESSVTDGGSCGDITEDLWSEAKCVPLIKKKYRGKWRRLDREEDYYLGTNGVKELYLSSSYQVYPAQLQRVDDNMIRMTLNDTEIRLIRNSITDARLEVHAKRKEAFTKSPGMGGAGGVDVIVENTDDPGETYSDKTDSNGNASFSDMISGKYLISVGSTELEMNISEHLDAGVFYFGSGFIYKAFMDSDTVFYAEKADKPEEGNDYNISLNVCNLGSSDASAATISMSTADPAVNLTAKDEILGTIEPSICKKYRFDITTVPFTKLSGFTNTVYHDVELDIKIKDINGEVWEDAVMLRIYRKPVTIYVRSEMSNPFILLSPHREIIKAGQQIQVPFRPDAKYKLIAQSLSTASEGIYSIGVGSFDSEKWQQDLEAFTDVSNYEPNDLESTAKTITRGSQITSYLHKNDIDFWIIDTK